MSIGLTEQYKYLLANGIGGIPNWRGRIYPHKQFCQNLRPPYFFHILLRCCLCNSVLIWAKVFKGQRFIFSAILNLLYHLLFFNLRHCFLYRHGRTVRRCYRVSSRWLIVARAGNSCRRGSFTSLLTAVSTHEEHHFPVYYEGVTLHPSHIITSS